MNSHKKEPVNEASDLKNPFLDDAVVKGEKNPFVEPVDETNPFLEPPVVDTNPFGATNEDNKASKDIVTNDSSLVSYENDPISMLDSSSTSKELLDWCKEIVKKNANKQAPSLFRSLAINDFSKSWMDGLALCSIIYSFKPNLM